MQKIDLAKIAGSYFISYLEFGVMSHQLKDASLWQNLKLLSSDSKAFTIRIDDSYNLTLNGLGGLVANIRSTSSQAHFRFKPWSRIAQSQNSDPRASQSRPSHFERVR